MGGFGYDVDLWANGSGYFGDVIQVQLGLWFWNGGGLHGSTTPVRWKAPGRPLYIRFESETLEISG
jgi:hypothetical protein